MIRLPTNMQQRPQVGFTSGPPGSSGGLTGSPWGQRPMQQPGPTGGFGYGTAPGQSGRGFYEQQTPVGSFAATEQQWSAGPTAPQQQYATAQGYENRYLGASTPGVSGAPSVAGSVGANPWLGGSSGQVSTPGANPYGMGNPELEAQIRAAQDDTARAWNLSVRPALDAKSRASGSFGNSALQELEGQAYGDLAQRLGQISSGMRFNDYTQQQQLAENALNRGLQADTVNLGARAGDLSRNLAGAFTQGGMGLDAAKFDASNIFGAQSLNSQLASNDLGRNAGLANAMGQFTAGAGNAASLFNAGQGNSLGQFFAQLMQGNRQFNAGQGNAINQANVNAGNSMLERYRDRTQQQGQFDANLDWGIDRDNWQRERTGQQDQIDLFGRLLGWNQGAIGTAQQQQDRPIDLLARLAQIANGFGGQGGSSSTPMNGNPVLGALAGWQLVNSLYGNGG